MKKIADYCEGVGLLFLLIAAITYPMFGSWFDELSRNWRDMISNEIIFTVLDTQRDLAVLIATEDGAKKIALIGEITDDTNRKIIWATRERESMSAFFSEGQGATYAAIQAAVTIIAAGLLFIAKLLHILAARSNKSSQMTPYRGG